MMTALAEMVVMVHYHPPPSGTFLRMRREAASSLALAYHRAAESAAERGRRRRQIRRRQRQRQQRPLRVPLFPHHCTGVQAPAGGRTMMGEKCHSQRSLLTSTSLRSSSSLREPSRTISAMPPEGAVFVFVFVVVVPARPPIPRLDDREGPVTRPPPSSS